MPRSRTPSAWSACEWVSTIPSIAPAASRTAARCPASAGPGSTTHPPTTQVFVPSSVMGDGFGATTRLTPGSGCCTFSTGKRDTRGMANGFGRSAADRRWALGAAALTTVLAGIDAALTGVVLTGILVLGPLLAAARSGPRVTGALAVYTVALGFRGRRVERHLPGGRAPHPPARARDRRGSSRSGSQRCGQSGERTNDHLLAQNALAVTLVESRSLADATPKALEAIGRTLGWQLGALWRSKSRATYWARRGLAGAGAQRGRLPRV